MIVLVLLAFVAGVAIYALCYGVQAWSKLEELEKRVKELESK